MASRSSRSRATAIPNSTALVIQGLIALGSKPTKPSVGSCAAATRTPRSRASNSDAPTPPPTAARTSSPASPLPATANTFATVQAGSRGRVGQVAGEEGGRSSADPVPFPCPASRAPACSDASVGSSTVVRRPDRVRRKACTCRVARRASVATTGRRRRRCKQAGFTVTGTTQFGLAFVCRINGQPTAATDPCTTTPPGERVLGLLPRDVGCDDVDEEQLGASTYAAARGQRRRVGVRRERDAEHHSDPGPPGVNRRPRPPVRSRRDRRDPCGRAPGAIGGRAGAASACTHDVRRHGHRRLHALGRRRRAAAARPGIPTTGLDALHDGRVHDRTARRSTATRSCAASTASRGAEPKRARRHRPATRTGPTTTQLPTDAGWTYNSSARRSTHPAAGIIEAWAFGAHAQTVGRDSGRSRRSAAPPPTAADAARR